MSDILMATWDISLMLIISLAGFSAVSLIIAISVASFRRYILFKGHLAKRYGNTVTHYFYNDEAKKRWRDRAKKMLPFKLNNNEDELNQAIHITGLFKDEIIPREERIEQLDLLWGKIRRLKAWQHGSFNCAWAEVVVDALYGDAFPNMCGNSRNEALANLQNHLIKMRDRAGKN